MRTIKTYEGFFDFLKKKKKVEKVEKVDKLVAFDDIMQCLYDLTDETRIDNELNGLKLGGVFTPDEIVFGINENEYDEFINSLFDDELNTDKIFKLVGKSISFRFRYYIDDISDLEVNELLTDCKSKLSIYGCDIKFFIGDSGHWNEFMKMIDKVTRKEVRTIIPPQFSLPRNITIKIISPNGFS